MIPPRVPPHRSRPRPSLSAGLLAGLLATSLLGLAACGPERSDRSEPGVTAAAAAAPRLELPRPPLVIFLSLDTLRADAVTAEDMPHLTAFGRDSVRFTEAHVPMAYTLPSHMSMFTGLYPGAHKVSTAQDVLAPGIPTLPEILQAAGYRTVGRMTNEWLKAEFGFGRGFDSYEKIKHRLTYMDRVAASGLEAIDDARGDRPLEGASDPAGPAPPSGAPEPDAPAGEETAPGEADGRPLFLFLHTLDPHSDFTGGFWFRDNRLPYYALPEDLDALVGPGGARPAAPPLEGSGDPRFCVDPGADDTCATAYLQHLNETDRRASDSELELLRHLYRAGVRGMDRQLGAFFDGLRERGLYDDALILVTSDHGEEFQEHGMFLHSQTYDESTAVPLLLKLPGNRLAGTTVDALNDSTDLLPTLLELLGLAAPENLQGTSLVPTLLPLMEDRPAGPARGRQVRPAILAQDKIDRGLFALRTPTEKLLWNYDTDTAELYDLVADPGETRNLAAERPERVQELARRMNDFLRDNRRIRAALEAAGATEGAQGEVLSDEERERLKSLGYLQ